MRLRSRIVWYFMSLFAKLGDIATTIYFVDKWGSKFESNAVVRNMINWMGLYPAMLVNWIIASTLISYLFFSEQRAWLLRATFVFLLAVVVWNLFWILLRAVEQ